MQLSTQCIKCLWVFVHKHLSAMKNGVNFRRSNCMLIHYHYQNLFFVVVVVVFAADGDVLKLLLV